MLKDCLTDLQMAKTQSSMWIYVCIFQQQKFSGRKRCTLKGKNRILEEQDLFCRSKLFPLRVDPYWEGKQNKIARVSSPECISIHFYMFFVSKIMCFHIFSDKMFPVLGFGAKLPDGTVSHEFPCVSLLSSC